MQENIEKLGGLIKDVKIAMLTSQDADGTLRSRPMATQKTPFDGTLWFFTQAHSPKVDEVEQSRQVNLSYAAPDDNTYVSVTGAAQLVRNQEKAKELWNPILKAWFPKGLEDPELALLCVTVEKAEYWDSPSSAMVQLAGYVKSVATGKGLTPTPGDHEKISL